MQTSCASRIYKYQYSNNGVMIHHIFYFIREGLNFARLGSHRISPKRRAFGENLSLSFPRLSDNEFRASKSSKWCPRPESNRHDRIGRQILSLLRLPVPPPGHCLQREFVPTSTPSSKKKPSRYSPHYFMVLILHEP